MESAEPTPPAARATGDTPLRAFDEYLFSGEPRYNAAELAERANLDEGLADRLWRAMGFTTGGPDEPTFMDADLDALRQAESALGRGARVEDIVYHTRVMAAGLSGVAEVAADQIVANLDELRQGGFSDQEIAAFLRGAERPDIDALVGYMYRRQLRAALWRKLADPEEGAAQDVVTVGFVDLVRFTAITENIAEEELGVLINRFEDAVHDRVHAAGGRIVKMIGDEVMFVSSHPEPALDIAMDLVATFHDDESVPNARAGLATGAVLAHGGDYFGPVVNLAARIVGVARPSAVVVSQPLYESVGERADLSWRRLPPKRLKGIGRARLWSVLRAGGQSPPVSAA
jgi:adenylate cyclase